MPEDHTIKVKVIDHDVVRAAQAIFARMPNAQQHDAILGKAKSAFAASDFADTLARVTLLDALYATKLMARSRMAEHIASLGDLNRWASDNCLVETIARLPPKHRWSHEGVVVESDVAGEREKQRCFKSFASKYAHIFVDDARFHILDDAAVRMIATHTSSTLTAARAWSYAEFNRRAEAVRIGSNLAADRSLDRYLWVTGMRYRHRAGGTANNELVSAFLDPSSRHDIALIDSVLPAMRNSYRSADDNPAAMKRVSPR